MVSTATLKMLPLVPYQSDKDTPTTGTLDTPNTPLNALIILSYTQTPEATND